MGKKVRDLAWPVAASLLGLLVFPILIEQYPETFKESPLILPLSVMATGLLYIIPFLVEERPRRLWRWGTGKIGNAATVILSLLILGVCSWALWQLYVFHVRHLEARLIKNSVPSPQQLPSQMQVPPPQPLPPQMQPVKTTEPSSIKTFPRAPESGLPQLVFSDSPLFTIQRRAHIEAELDAYRDYLHKVGFDVSTPVFPIHVSPGKVFGLAYTTPGTVYDGAIFLGEKSIDDPLTLRRAYGQFYFSQVIGNVTTAAGLSGQLKWIYDWYFLDSYPGGHGLSLPPQSSTTPWIEALRDLRHQFGAETTGRGLCIGLQRRTDSRTYKSADDYTVAVINLGFAPLLNDLSELEKVDDAFRKRGLIPPSS